ncbi:MAG: hypothetical protein ACTSYB_12440 [Candidatus Helarchaeota archaeon]
MHMGKIIGGIISLICGLLIIIQTFMLREYIRIGESFFIAWVLNLIIAILVITGSILSLVDKGGTGLVLVMGAISITLAIIASMSIDLMFLLMQFSFLSMTLGMGAFMGITLESIIVVIAGIIIVISPSKKI